MKKTFPLATLLSFLLMFFVACDSKDPPSVDTSKTETSVDIVDPDANRADSKEPDTANPDTVPEEPDSIVTDPVETAPSETIHTHVWSDWQTTQAATCTEAGASERFCVCGEREQQPIDALGHTPGAEATCTTAQICVVCDAELLAPLGHTEVIDATVAPTCTETGLTEGKHCSVCNDVQICQQVIPITEHSFTQTIADLKYLMSDATCTEAASYYKSCVCGEKGTEIFKHGSINPDNHTNVVEREYLNRNELGHEIINVYQCCQKTEGSPTMEPHVIKDGTCTNCTFEITYTNFIIFESNRDKIGYTGDEGESLSIPETFQDVDGTWYKVTGIGYTAFYMCKNLVSVTIPNSVTEISSWAFGGCEQLMEIHIPDSVTQLGDSVFVGCANLKSVSLPASITSIQSQTFWGCSNLANLLVNGEITSIGDSAFHGCKNLDSIVIPQSVETIGSSVFFDCTKLTIRCKAPQKQVGWSEEWNPSNCPVVWSYVCDDIGHVEVIDNAVEPTCSSAGFTEGKHCSVCNFVIAAQTVIPSKEHIYDGTEDPTCNICGSTIWNFLFVVLGNTSLNTYDQDTNQQIDVSHVLTEDEYKAICKSIDDFKCDLTTKSNAQVTVNTVVVKCDTEYTNYSKIEVGYYIPAGHAYEYLVAENINIDSYDHVVFVTSFPDLPRNYFGLGGTNIHNHCGFSLIVYGSGATDCTKYCYDVSQTNWPAGVYVHEFIHSMERYAAEFGYFVPSADGAEQYGYKNVDHWRNYYTDIINNNVMYGGKYIGVPPCVWSQPPRLFA